MPLNGAKPRLAVIGLGYVGLPLAVEFGKHYDTVGFDIDATRIAELRRGEDRTRELSPQEMGDSPQLSYAHTLEDLAECNFFIVTVPTRSITTSSLI